MFLLYRYIGWKICVLNLLSQRCGFQCFSKPDISLWYNLECYLPGTIFKRNSQLLLQLSLCLTKDLIHNSNLFVTELLESCVCEVESQALEKIYDYVNELLSQNNSTSQKHSDHIWFLRNVLNLILKKKKAQKPQAIFFSGLAQLHSLIILADNKYGDHQILCVLHSLSFQ